VVFAQCVVVRVWLCLWPTHTCLLKTHAHSPQKERDKKIDKRPGESVVDRKVYPVYSSQSIRSRVPESKKSFIDPRVV